MEATQTLRHTTYTYSIVYFQGCLGSTVLRTPSKSNQARQTNNCKRESDDEVNSGSRHNSHNVIAILPPSSNRCPLPLLSLIIVNCATHLLSLFALSLLRVKREEKRQDRAPYKISPPPGPLQPPGANQTNLSATQRNANANATQAHGPIRLSQTCFKAPLRVTISLSCPPTTPRSSILSQIIRIWFL